MENALPHAPPILVDKTTSQTLVLASSSPKSPRFALLWLNQVQIRVVLSLLIRSVLKSGGNLGFPSQFQFFRCICVVLFPLLRFGLTVARWSVKIREHVKLYVVKDYRKRKKSLSGVGGDSVDYWFYVGAWLGLGGVALRFTAVVWLLLLFSSFRCLVLDGCLPPEFLIPAELLTISLFLLGASFSWPLVEGVLALLLRSGGAQGKDLFTVFLGLVAEAYSSLEGAVYGPLASLASLLVEVLMRFFPRGLQCLDS